MCKMKAKTDTHATQKLSTAQNVVLIVVVVERTTLLTHGVILMRKIFVGNASW